MTDKEILQLYHSEQGVQQAFNMIVRQYSSRLYWHLREMVLSHDDANDLLQDTLIKAWNALPNFRGESGLYTWLYRIATNEAFTFLKKERINSKFSLTSFESKLKKRLSEDLYFSGDTMQMMLQREVAKLPDRQRAIFSMRYFQNMSYADIGEILGSNGDAIKASYSIAYKKISSNLKKLI